MKHFTIWILLIAMMLTLSSCYKRLDQRFTIPLDDATFSYQDDNELDYLGYKITTFEVTFAKTYQTTELLDEYDLNLFADFSKVPIELYEVDFIVAFDHEEAHHYDAKFIGQANPGRKNAYRFYLYIPGLFSVTDEYTIIFEFDPKENHEQLEIISVQLQDNINGYPNDRDTFFDIKRKNTDE
ncbi:MAG: hypothetical protein WC992_01095 [Acholeplasmataceae bacterium]|jgi:hypothetical protein|nr:hypothetical protein [Acholeplasmataceae bacterium]